MSGEHRKSSVGFWAAAILSLPVLYVGSFGPACWWAAHSHARSDSGTPFWVIYWPLGQVMRKEVPGASRKLGEYGILRMRPGGEILVPSCPPHDRIWLARDGLGIAPNQALSLGVP